MTTSTQYNPNADLNRLLLNAGASKTVYALVTPRTVLAKEALFGNAGDPARQDYLSMFTEAWTGKQDELHVEFFNTWHAWSQPVVDLDRANFPFFYPTNGASESIRQIIFDQASIKHGFSSIPPRIHFFEGEYEGYKAMAEAAGLEVWEHPRNHWQEAVKCVSHHDLFFISQPSAIDGNIWRDFNVFVAAMPANSVVADITYVGAFTYGTMLNHERFNLNAPSIRSVIFSLSKPFGVYYDRVGGVFFREENLALFGNRWFKNLTSLRLGTTLMEMNDVFHVAEAYEDDQKAALDWVSNALAVDLKPSDVFILGNAEPNGSELSSYLQRGQTVRACVTPRMAAAINREPA